MLKLRQAEYDAIRCHGEEAYPHECCGVLLGVIAGDTREVRSAVRCHNARTDSPGTRYSIDPIELVRIQREARDQGCNIVGFYHSHPDNPARWSPTDLQEAHWVCCSYVITSVERGRAGATSSFALTGTLEEDKALVAEEIAVVQTPR
jgi:proteasome lid subunit RPN8/RPN11